LVTGLAPSPVTAGGGAFIAIKLRIGVDDISGLLLLLVELGDRHCLKTKNPAGRWGEQGFRNCDDLHLLRSLPACIPGKFAAPGIGLMKDDARQ